MFSRNSSPRPVQRKRSANRLPMGVAAMLELASGRRSCLLDDISATGARLRIEPAPGQGALALLRFHDLQVYGVIVWSHGSECGMRFDKPLPAEDMRGMLWIVQNREAYTRICNNSHAQDWAWGMWD